MWCSIQIQVGVGGSLYTVLLCMFMSRKGRWQLDSIPMVNWMLRWLRKLLSFSGPPNRTSKWACSPPCWMPLPQSLPWSWQWWVTAVSPQQLCPSVHGTGYWNIGTMKRWCGGTVRRCLHQRVHSEDQEIPIQHPYEERDEVRTDRDVIQLELESAQCVDEILRISHVVWGVTQTC